MGHRSCIRHRPTTLPGAPSRTQAHRHLGRAGKTKPGPSRPPRLSTTHVIISEGRRPGGSIGAAFRSIVLPLFLLHYHHLLDDVPIVRHFRPILSPPGGFGESPVRERPTAGPIDRSSRSTTTSGVLDAGSVNELVKSGVQHGRQAREAGIPDEYRACESISEFDEARSKVLEGPGGSSTTSSRSSGSNSSAAGVERSSGSIDELILSSRVGLLGGPSIQFVKSIRGKDSRIKLATRLAKAVVDLEEQFPIIASWPILHAFRLPLSSPRITRVGHVSTVPSGSRKSINQFSQPAILETIIRFLSPWGSLILVAVPSRTAAAAAVAVASASAMTSAKATSFR